MTAEQAAVAERLAAAVPFLLPDCIDVLRAADWDADLAEWALGVQAAGLADAIAAINARHTYGEGKTT